MAPALPQVQSATTSPGGVRLELAVPTALRYFSGHFPGCPILPGVVQLHWAMALAQRHLGASPEVTRVVGLKFSRIVQPGERLTLHLAHSDAGFRFHFERDGAACSSGRFICVQ